MANQSTLLRGVTLASGAVADVRLANGCIEAVDPAGGARSRRLEEILELEGYLLIGAFAEPHAHLDKAFTADLLTNPSEDLDGAVSEWREFRRTLSAADIFDRARRAALTSLAHGTTAIRTHVDIGPGLELRGVEALIQLREELHGLVELQVVPMAYPLLGEDAQQAQDRLRAAMALGADLVGGVPHHDADPADAVRKYLEIASEFGASVDLHVDEHIGEAEVLPELAAQAAAGFGHSVTASHCVSLGMRPRTVQEQVVRHLIAADVGVVTCPATNLYLQARDRVTAVPRGLTALRVMLGGGAKLAGGGDNIQDLFNPLGRGDPLETAQLLVLAGHLTPAEAHVLVGDGARTVMGLAPLPVVSGSPADLVAVSGSSLREVIASRTDDRLVIKAGRIVARTSVRRELVEIEGSTSVVAAGSTSAP